MAKICVILVYVHPIWKHLFVYVFFHYKAGSTFIFIHLNNEEEEVWPISIGKSRAGRSSSQKEADGGSYEKARRSKHICHPNLPSQIPLFILRGEGSTVLLRGKGFSKLLSSLYIGNSTKGMLKMSNWKLGFLIALSKLWWLIFCKGGWKE